ncbi:uncharacterized protein LOC127844586 isoform X2 [Dreissena polymorpha]|uniref:uncharacterized protein LOC127844586 isoform X2 n=1 Tax=Dreissena polymorpha TaxID=45954 RepID=UPI0022654707|nr:uncharacterized protein LOC127844586 isoform X2 [Dreissena polymorpha]
MDVNVLCVVVLFMLVSFHRLSFSLPDTLENSASLEMKTSADCPATTDSTHGQWSESVKDGAIECELRCDGGYEPNTCNVLMKTGNGTWDKQVPNCVKEPWTSTIWGKLIISAVSGVAGFVGVPIVIWLICSRSTECMLIHMMLICRFQTLKPEVALLVVRAQVPRGVLHGFWFRFS